MTRAEYEERICARRQEAVRVPFRRVSIGDWSPKASECHQNVDRWVGANPEYEAVRGWVTNGSLGGTGFRLTAHSVVRGKDGKPFDITPVGDESWRVWMHFIEHEGDQDAFVAMKRNVDIDCYDWTHAATALFESDSLNVHEDE